MSRRRAGGMLVSISGPDGSGKSTLVRGTVQALSVRGITAKVVYGRYQPWLLRPAVAANNTSYQTMRSEEMWSTRGRRITRSIPLAGFAFTAILVFDYAFSVLPRLKRLRRQHEFVILDRYVVDTLISDFAIGHERNDSQLRWVMRLLLGILPKPSLAVVLYVHPDVATARKSDIPGSWYVARWWDFFLRFVGPDEMLVLDGNGNADANIKTVTDLIVRLKKGKMEQVTV